MNKKDFDHIFDEMFEEAIKEAPETPIPDFMPAWERTQKRLKQERRKQVIKRKMRKVSVIAVSIFIGGVLFANPVVTKAFTPFYQTIKEFPGEIVSFFFGSQDRSENGAKTKPPTDKRNINDNKTDIDDGGQLQILEVSLEDAKKKVNFTIPSFGYIPLGYKLQKTELFLLPNENTANKIRFTFKNQANTVFWVTMKRLDGDMTIGSGANQSDVQEVSLKRGTGYLAIAKYGTSKLDFLNVNLHVAILGKLAKDG